MQLNYRKKKNTSVFALFFIFFGVSPATAGAGLFGAAQSLALAGRSPPQPQAGQAVAHLLSLTQ
jgi:hypothetical protein